MQVALETIAFAFVAFGVVCFGGVQVVTVVWPFGEPRRPRR